MKCPKCNNQCEQDSVDVGVGIIYGPWGCYFCGWSEDSEYDRSNGRPSPAQQRLPNHYVDPCGGAIPLDRIADRLDRLGRDGKRIVREAFGEDF